MIKTSTPKPLPNWFVPLLIGSGVLVFFLGAKKLEGAQ